MLTLGMGYVKADVKRVPKIIFSSKITNRCAFLAGLFDTDGSINKKGKIRYTTASLKLAEDIQLILKSIGIISFLSSQGDKHHKVIICGIDTLIFKEKIPIKCKRKRNIIDTYKIKSTGKTNHYEIPFGTIFVELFKKYFNKNEGKSQGIKGKGLFSKYKGLFEALSDIKNGKNKMRRNIIKKMGLVAKKEKFKLPEIISQELKNN
jgi:intein/homing endonuclease